MQSSALSPALASHQERALEFLAQAKSANTIRAYRADWSCFETWCRNAALRALPAEPQTLALYLTDLSGTVKASTLDRRLSSIRQAHQIAGCEPPTASLIVRELMAGIRRGKGTRREGKHPVLVEDLKRMLPSIPDSVLGLRDRALLLLGFSGAFRRSELVGLDCADIRRQAHGLVVTIRRSKTDATGQGRAVAIPYGNAKENTCAASALDRWLASAGIVDGPIFRPVNKHSQAGKTRLSAAAVASVVKRWVETLGYDPSQFGGHSLRAGLATSAAIAGKPERVIMQQTGHRSLTTLRRYIRDGNLFRENAAEGLGL